MRQRAVKNILLVVIVGLLFSSSAHSDPSLDTISLSPGWNFISFPKQPPNTAIGTVLAGVSANVAIAWGYDNQNKTWQKYIPGGASNSLSTMEAGKGYWIYMTATGTVNMTGWAPAIASVILYEGWNLVGFSGADIEDLTTALASISNKWALVWNWTGGQWYGKHIKLTTLPSPIQALTGFAQGKAYWVKIGGAQADWDQPGDGGNYLPTTVGNSWGFRVTVSETGQPAVTYNDTFTITGTKEINGVQTLVFTEWNPSNSGVPEEDYRLKNAAGVTYYGNNDASDTLTPQLVPYREVTFPLKPGSSVVQMNKAGLDYGADLDGDGVNERLAAYSQVTVVGFESVSVDAGTFHNCAKLQTTLTETVTSSRYGFPITATGTLTEWYAPGVGPVKRYSVASAPALGYSRTEAATLVSYEVDGHRSDTSRPTVVLAQPINLATGAEASVISATFNEDMDPSSITTGTFVVKGSNNYPIVGTVSYQSLYRKAIFTPASPIPDGTCTATVSAAVRDLIGNTIATPYSWDFTVDSIPPYVVSTNPANGATGVSISSRITVEFSEDMDYRLSSYFFEVRTAAGSSVMAAPAFDSRRVAAFIPWSNLEGNTTYTVTIRTPSFTDPAGNPLPAEYTWSFTTGPCSFLPYIALPTGSHPEAVAIGDVNGDGRNDVVMTTSFDVDPDNDYKLFVFLQNASGGLDPPIKYTTSGTYDCRPRTVAIGDVNHDGRTDVVVGNSGCTIEVFLQNASGGIDPGATHVTTDSYRVKIADFNHDGLLDIVGIGQSNSSLSIWHQAADGTLNAPVGYQVTHTGDDDLDVGDVNNDGRTDIIVKNGGIGMVPAPNIALLTQKPNGTLNDPQYYSLSPWKDTIAGVAVGDVNGDGLNDVAVAYEGNSPYSQIAVFLQNAEGTLNPALMYGSRNGPEAVEIADVDNDGRADIIVLHGGFNTMGIYLQSTEGTLKNEEGYPIPYASHYNLNGLAIGDINGDGLKDAVIADYLNGLVVLYHAPPQ